jgi:Na+/proline symporter/signal transduction histidine kinase/ActR/RegA family two-component response regulator
VPAWIVLFVSALYLTALCAIASWGNRSLSDRPLFPRGSILSAILYALTLGIHTTAWSYYGGPGRGAAKGFDYLATPIGAFLFLMLGQGALRRVIAVTKARNATSISDFISARYGKGRFIAVLLTIASTIGLLPYLALQLKAVAFSFEILTHTDTTLAKPAAGLASTADLWAALILAAFSAFFGIRHIHAGERHRGFVLALAFESLVKLAAFIIVALFIVHSARGGFGQLFAHAGDNSALSPLLTPNFNEPAWYSKAAVAFLAFLCLPQFFHVGVIENDDLSSVRPAALLYPVYELAFCVFMTPIALVGLETFGATVNPDTYVISIPVASHAPVMGLLAFIGGLSAAAGMVMVSSVALSAMLCNDIVLPPLLHRISPQSQLGIAPLLFAIRRTLVFVIMLLAFVTQRFIEDSTSLVEMGVMSFLAAAQLAPALFGGLYWPRAKAIGALAGTAIGFAMWLYTLALPSVAGVLGLPRAFLETGPWGLGWLSPHGMIGFASLDPFSHAALLSLALNVAVFAVLSFVVPATKEDNESASAFAEDATSAALALSCARTMEDLVVLAGRFVGFEAARDAFAKYLIARAGRTRAVSDLSAGADLDAARFAENLIAGAIGAASARIALAATLRDRNLSKAFAASMLEDASTVLHDNYKLLCSITENMAQGVLAVDAELRLSAWNSRFAAILGLPREVLKVGVPLATLVEINKARGEYSSEDLGLLLVNRDLTAQTWPYVYERMRPDGTVLEVSINRMESSGYVTTYRDVTDRHRAAEALRAANEALERRVLERTRELERAKTAAERANASKTRFLAAASHDLMQPLSSARLYLAAQQAMLRRRDAGAVDAQKIASWTESALAALQSTEYMLSELLYVASLESRAIRPEISEVAMPEILARLELEFVPLAKEKGLRLRVAPTTLAVSTDANLLLRALRNLVANAVRYTPEGGVLIGCRRRGDRVRIEVWDTGVGVPEDKRSEIFMEFTRLKREPSEAKGGFGLGLAVVDRIAGLLLTQVHLSSQPGRGSVFSLEIPGRRAAGVARAIPAAQDSLASPPRRLSVLCIDDEPSFRDGIAALIEQWGHAAVCAGDPQMALRLCGDTAPDVLLLDYHLKGGHTGFDALRMLRARWRNDVVTILITADRAPHLHAKAQAARCELLHKPIDGAVLRRLLEAAALHAEIGRE